MNDAAIAVFRGLAIAGEPRALLRPAPSPVVVLGGAPQERVPEGALPRVDPAELEQLRKDAYRQGLEQGRRDGFAEGKDEGLQKGQAEGRQIGQDAVLRQAQAAREDLGMLVDRLDQLLATLPGQFRDALAARLAAGEDDMVALCHAAICRLLGERALSRDGVVHAVRQAVSDSSGATSHAAMSRLLAIHVHPQDLEMLRSDADLSAWLDRHGSGTIPWRADETVRLGGCIVHTTHGSLDARLETQMTALQEILLSARTGHPDRSPSQAVERGDRR
jgi:flagellar assembly protein FliH